MSDTEDKTKANDGSLEGPAAEYLPFVIMEELLDKLKLIGYEDAFCKQLSHKPISRHYFALATNSGEQFFAFASLAAWLLQIIGRQFDTPEENDDPNGIISGILEELRQLGHKPDFAPSKLKSGSGDQCLWTLDRLADEALMAKKFAWKKPQYPEEENEEENMAEDNNDEDDLDNNRFAEEIMDDEMEEEPLLTLDDLQSKSDAKNQPISKPEVILESNTDAQEWKMEVERVLPQLKVPIRQDNKDWRVHFDQMNQHKENIDVCLKDSKTQLDKLHDEISKTLEKVTSREKYLNSQLEKKLVDFRTKQDTLSETKEQYKQAGSGVTERTRTLAEISDDLDRTKQELDGRGSTVTDGGPVKRLSNAIEDLKQESRMLDIRTGVLQHVLLRTELKERSLQPRNRANESSEKKAATKAY